MEYVGKRTLLSLINDHPEAVTEQFQAKCFRYNPDVTFSNCNVIGNAIRI